MKTITLMAALFLATSAANALTHFAPERFGFSYEQPVSFVERGIEFLIFPDGTFDFNTQPSHVGGIYYRTKATNAGYGVPGTGNGIRIEHDSFGRIRRIGNVFLNYDHSGKIKRIGTVYMTYNRSVLTQIGGLRIHYDRRGRAYATTGIVKASGNPVVYNDYNNYVPAPLNEDFYYYRMDGTKAKIEDKIRN